MQPLIPNIDLSKFPAPKADENAKGLANSYLYGYSFINPIKEKQEWEYAIQLHKNQNGKHWDLRLAAPGADKAYSWASKKLPIASPKPVLAMRTNDHQLQHMEFEGPMNTRRGYGTVQLVQRGKTTMKSIDENGLKFTLNGEDYRLYPLRGKKYMFEKVIYD